jgi:hypothetical protein
MVSDEEQKVAASETDIAPPPSRTWRRFLRDVELFDLITALATTSIAILTGVYVHYAHGQLTAMRGELESARKSIANVERAFRLDHRPWVVGSKYVLSAEPDTKSGTKAPTITLWVKNAGNTPATAVVCHGKMVMSKTQPPEFEPKSTTERPIGSGELSSYAEPVTIDDIDDTIRNPFSVAAYKEGKLNLYFQGQIRYKDILGVDHCTKVCMYHVHGRGLTTFYGCSEGNEMDIERASATINKGTLGPRSNGGRRSQGQPG